MGQGRHQDLLDGPEGVRGYSDFIEGRFSVRIPHTLEGPATESAIAPMHLNDAWLSHLLYLGDILCVATCAECLTSRLVSHDYGDELRERLPAVASDFARDGESAVFVVDHDEC